MMSHIMIVEGYDESTYKVTINLPGMGLNVIIDQHFNQGVELDDYGVAQNPQILGIGIDEDTAIIVEANRSFFVLGREWPQLI